LTPAAVAGKARLQVAHLRERRGAWNHIAWITNYFDLGARPARLVLIGLMLASLIMSSSLFGAFENHGLGFAGALSTSLLGGQLCALAAVGPRHPLTLVFGRVPSSGSFRARRARLPRS
jgi:hypothetical protein